MNNVSFSFKKDGEWIRNFDASDCFPDEIESLKIKGPVDTYSMSYEVFTTLLKNSSRQFDSIICSDLSAESPELLAFLVLVCNKAKSLYFSKCQFSSNAMTCLMAALLARDGIHQLSIYEDRSSMTTDEANILFQGIASSPCLESFELDIQSFYGSEEIDSRFLIQSLQRNQSLKDISLTTCLFDRSDSNFLAKLLKASITGPNVKDVSIHNCDGASIQIDSLRDLLCRKDCTLEKLYLSDIQILAERDWDGPTIQNMSVTNLTMMESPLSEEHELPQALSLFKSLVDLDLSANRIKKLAFLDPLLFGGSSQLESLDLSYNEIEDEEIKKFIERLRKIRGLRHLAISGDDGWLSDCDDWEISDSVTATLNDVLRTNTDLEHVRFMQRDDLPLALNRGGRRVFEPSLESFPRNLLPRVLERASKITYYETNDVWESPTNEKPRADVVFWMMQRVVLHL